MSSKRATKPKPKVQTPCDRCPLRGLDTFRDFTPEELAFMLEFKSGELVLDAGTSILHEGSNSPHLYTVLSGWAYKYKTLPDGRRQVLNYALPGDFIGLQASIFDVSSHSVEALTDVVLCVFPRERLWDLFARHTGLAFDVTWLGAHEENILGDFLVSVGKRSATERVAFVLLQLFARARQAGLVKNGALGFPVTQELLADTVGFSLVHTNKTLKRLRRSKAFTWQGPTLEVASEDKLAELASTSPPGAGRRPLI